jgi:hypothetical protein
MARLHLITSAVLALGLIGCFKPTADVPNTANTLPPVEKESGEVPRPEVPPLPAVDPKVNKTDDTPLITARQLTGHFTGKKKRTLAESSTYKPFQKLVIAGVVKKIANEGLLAPKVVYLVGHSSMKESETVPGAFIKNESDVRCVFDKGDEVEGEVKVGEVIIVEGNLWDVTSRREHFKDEVTSVEVTGAKFIGKMDAKDFQLLNTPR